MPRGLVRLGLCGVALVLGIATASWLTAQPNAAKAPASPEEQLKPNWKVGDRWIIETSTPPLQASIGDAKAEDVKVRWEFTVKSQEKLTGKDCFVIEITGTGSPEAEKQPKSSIWLDATTLALRQVQTQLPVPGGYTTVTESYEFAGPGAPVTSSFSGLPVDMPLFLSTAGTRSATGTKFTFSTVSGAAGTRAADDVGFGIEIEQSIKPVDPAATRGLVLESFTRDLVQKPIFEVNLKTSERTVKQYWQTSQPWPVYSDNGTTKAKLIEVKPAQK